MFTQEQKVSHVGIPIIITILHSSVVAYTSLTIYFTVLIKKRDIWTVRFCIDVA